ncbi:MAG: type III pantothenate kinase [Methylomonas sp.]|jgi:type III pantothenate kinase
MNILVDIGNTRLKWAVVQEGQFRAGSALPYRARDIWRQLRTDWRHLPIPRTFCVASVGAETLKEEVIGLARQLWPQVELIQPIARASAFGVINAYKQPDALGIDRWLALLAVRKFYPGPHCIMDCGTAITVDVLTGEGRHLGGLICPGLQLMKKALLANTSALQFDGLAHGYGLADSTSAAIDSGVLHAAVGMIEALLPRLPEPYPLILTGGDAAPVAAQLRSAYSLDENLVLKGLSLYCI